MVVSFKDDQGNFQIKVTKMTFIKEHTLSEVNAAYKEIA